LLRKNATFWFGAGENTAFMRLKDKLVLAIYSPDFKTELHCDASASGFGVILIKKQSNDFFRPVFYFSKRITIIGSKYSSFF
jgi:hypothetical protein